MISSRILERLFENQWWVGITGASEASRCFGLENGSFFLCSCGWVIDKFIKSFVVEFG